MTYSLQLYTLRSAMADPDATLRAVAHMGYRLVEPYAFVSEPEQLRALLDAHGLSAPSAHTKFLSQDVDTIFAAARTLGVGTLVQPSSDPHLWESPDGIRQLAADLNEAAVRAADHDLTLGYHNHAFEYAGGIDRPLERLAEHLSDNVVLEVDTYWAANGGDDVVALLRRLGDVVQLIHLKDGPITMDTVQQVAVGDGAMPIPEIVAAAPQALGVVELDDCSTSVMTAVERSLRYLENMA